MSTISTFNNLLDEFMSSKKFHEEAIAKIKNFCDELYNYNVNAVGNLFAISMGDTMPANLRAFAKSKPLQQMSKTKFNDLN